jgi:lysozyme family protein
MQAGWHRRSILAGGASLIALLIPGRARALPTEEELRRLVGRGLPQQLRGIVPDEAFEAAGFVQTLLSLETEAKALRLPKSALSLHEGEIPTDPERLYELALPRLVALVDRSELRNLGFAEKVGGLLAKLHGTQHVTPEGYLTLDAPVAVPLGLTEQAMQGPLTLPMTPTVLPAPIAVEPAPPEPEPEEPAPATPAAALPAPVPATARPLSRSIKFPDLEEEYRALYASLDIRPQHRETAEWHRTMMVQARGRYEGAAKRSGVPWYFIAAVHGLEASFNFRAHFHNGDHPLHQRTRQVPAGRPRVWLPPSDWESSTVDALRLMGFAGQDDWSLPRLLHRIEAFNGFGYRRMGRTTPYLWCFSNHYERGKYVADGKFDPRARSQQCGAAVMFKLLEEAGTVSFT